MTVKQQAELLDINRSSAYRKPPDRTISDEELFIMRLIDEIHTAEPTWGYRTITTILKKVYELAINKKRVRRIMRDMGIYTLYPKPNLSPGATILSMFAPICCGTLKSPDQTRYGAWISPTFV